jgi:hypothetical protein
MWSNTNTRRLDESSGSALTDTKGSSQSLRDSACNRPANALYNVRTTASASCSLRLQRCKCNERKCGNADEDAITSVNIDLNGIASE